MTVNEFYYYLSAWFSTGLEVTMIVTLMNARTLSCEKGTVQYVQSTILRENSRCWGAKVGISPFTAGAIKVALGPLGLLLVIFKTVGAVLFFVRSPKTRHEKLVKLVDEYLALATDTSIRRLLLDNDRKVYEDEKDNREAVRLLVYGLR